MAKDKAPKKAKKPKGPADSATAISISAHPRAAYSIPLAARRGTSSTWATASCRRPPSNPFPRW